MKKTPVKRIVDQFNLQSDQDFKSWMLNEMDKLFEAEASLAQEYAEFCIRCDRANLPCIRFEDWLKPNMFDKNE